MQSTASREPLRATHDDSAPDELLAAVYLSPLPVSPRRAPTLETGVVRGTASGLLVELGSGPALATRAKSCLVAPDAGDRVLCAVDGDRVFVLAVLEGDAGAATRIVAEGDLKVQATGRLDLGAGEQVEIAAAKEVGVFAGKLQVRAQAASRVQRYGRTPSAWCYVAVIAGASGVEGLHDRIRHVLSTSPYSLTPRVRNGSKNLAFAERVCLSYPPP